MPSRSSTRVVARSPKPVLMPYKVSPPEARPSKVGVATFDSGDSFRRQRPGHPFLVRELPKHVSPPPTLGKRLPLALRFRAFVMARFHAGKIPRGRYLAGSIFPHAIHLPLVPLCSLGFVRCLGPNRGAPSRIHRIRFGQRPPRHPSRRPLHPLVAVTVLYHVGSKNERTDRTGMAHFFEHLLFEGSENISRGEFDAYVENAGGILNANTTQDRTFYYELLPSNQLELGLWLESERMLHAKIEQIGIDTQNEVVKEEKRQRYDNQPYGQLLPTTMAMAYSEHPYQWTPIGSMEHLDAADHADFMDFYKTFYVPENATLNIAGDLDVTQARALIEKYFQDIPRGGYIPVPRSLNPRAPRKSATPSTARTAFHSWCKPTPSLPKARQIITRSTCSTKS